MRDRMSTNLCPTAMHCDQGYAAGYENARREIHVSSNTYYGYTPLLIEQNKNKNDKKNTDESMDVVECCQQDTGSFGVQFNNYIPLDERLCPGENAQNKKRPFHTMCDDGSTQARATFKKMRTSEEVQVQLPLDCTGQNGFRQPTHNVPDVARVLMGHYI